VIAPVNRWGGLRTTEPYPTLTKRWVSGLKLQLYIAMRGNKPCELQQLFVQVVEAGKFQAGCRADADGGHPRSSRKIGPWSSISNVRLLHRSTRITHSQPKLGQRYYAGLFRSFVFRGGVPDDSARRPPCSRQKTTRIR